MGCVGTQTGNRVPRESMGWPLIGGDLNQVTFPLWDSVSPSIKWAWTWQAHWAVVHVFEALGTELTKQKDDDSVGWLPQRWSLGPILLLSLMEKDQRVRDEAGCFHSRACISSPGTLSHGPQISGADTQDVLVLEQTYSDIPAHQWKLSLGMLI